MEGRRADLLRKRRDELATMPHALRRVYVARVSRVSAALTACLGGTVLMGAAVNPSYEGYLATLLPGKYPAVLSTLLLGTLVLSALSYLLGRCIAEARFTHAMSKCVLPDGDACSDVERLNATRPDELASAMIGRFESPAAVLPPVAIALAAPAALVYAAMAFAAGGYPKEAEIDASFAAGSSTLLTIGLAGVCAALYLGLARNRSSWKRTAVIGATIAGSYTLVMHLASNASAWVWAGFALVAGSLVGSLALLNREHRIVVLDDPGATLWTVRGTLTAAWELCKQAAALLTWQNIKKLPAMTRAGLGKPVGKLAMVGGALTIACAGYLAYDGNQALAVDRNNPLQAHQAVAMPDMDNIDVSIPTTPVAVQRDKGAIEFGDANLTGSMRLLGVDGAFPLRDSSGHRLKVPAGRTARITIELTGPENPYDDDLGIELLVNGKVVDSTTTGTIKWFRLDTAGKPRVLGVRTRLDRGVNAELRYQVTFERPLPELR
jgi:hypothetical protein